MFRRLGLFAVVVAFSVAPTAHAEDAPWIQASTWARENTGIGIAVRLGSDAGYPPEAVENLFEKGFRDNYSIEANAFVQQDDTPGTSVGYFFKKIGLEPMPFSVATSQATLDHVVAQYRQALSME